MKSMGVFCEHQLVTDWINDLCFILCTSEKLLLDVAVGYSILLYYVEICCWQEPVAREIIDPRTYLVYYFSTYYCSLNQGFATFLMP